LEAGVAGDFKQGGDDENGKRPKGRGDKTAENIFHG
jgi:hypothetical protein